MSGGKTIPFEATRLDRVTLAVGAVDGVTGVMLRHGVTARIAGLADQPIVNGSGLLVFVNLPDRPHYDVEVDARRAGFPFLEHFSFTPPAPGNRDPAARRRDIVMAPGPDYPFAPEATVVRGVVTRGASPVAGASISAAPACGGTGFTTRSVYNGAFALAVRLPHIGAHEAGGPVQMKIRVSEGGQGRAFVRALTDGRSHSFTEPLDLAGHDEPGLFLHLR